MTHTSIAPHPRSPSLTLSTGVAQAPPTPGPPLPAPPARRPSPARRRALVGPPALQRVLRGRRRLDALRVQPQRVGVERGLFSQEPGAGEKARYAEKQKKLVAHFKHASAAHEVQWLRS